MLGRRTRLVASSCWSVCRRCRVRSASAAGVSVGAAAGAALGSDAFSSGGVSCVSTTRWSLSSRADGRFFDMPPPMLQIPCEFLTTRRGRETRRARRRSRGARPTRRGSL